MSGDQRSPGVGTDLVYRDPWGNPYIVTIDMNADGLTRDSFYAQQNVSGGANGSSSLVPNASGHHSMLPTITMRRPP